MGRGSENTVVQRYIYMANKLMKSCSTSLAIRKMLMASEKSKYYEILLRNNLGWL